jgi:hypothetical protein
MFKKNTQKPAPRTRNPRLQPQTNKIFSYYNVKRPTVADETEEPSARQSRGQTTAKNTRQIFFRRLGAAAVFILILTVLFLNARLKPSETQVTLKGAPEQRLLLRDESIYKMGAAKIMNETFQDRNKLSFNGKSFSAAMVRQYPEIAHVNVSLPLIGNKASLYIEPSSAALEFIAQDKKAYIVDNNGKVISTDTANKPQAIPTVTDQSGVTPRMNAQVLPRSDVAAIQTILGQLKEKGIPVESLVLPKAAQRLEVRIQGKPYYIKFNLHDNVAQQVGAYIAVQQKLNREGMTPKEYIDVRVADRVYYK